MSDKILVTGGCGFIGSNIVNYLVAEGYQVLVLDNLSKGKRVYIETSLQERGCRFIKGSITNLKLLMKILKGIDVVIHEAANLDVRSSTVNLSKDFETNVRGTVNILQAMVKNTVSKIIFASSGGTVYGESVPLPTTEYEPLAPISHYGASKAACEQYLSSFSSLYELEAYSLRLGNIYGAPSNHGVIYDFFWKLRKDPTILEILGDGKQIKSYLYIDDCVDAHIKAMSKTSKGHTPLNIASTEGITVDEIASEVIAAMNLAYVSRKYTGGERGWIGDVRKALMDISKAEAVLSWKPTTTIKEGIQSYIRWLKSVYSNNTRLQ